MLFVPFIFRIASTKKLLFDAYCIPFIWIQLSFFSASPECDCSLLYSCSDVSCADLVLFLLLLFSYIFFSVSSRTFHICSFFLIHIIFYIVEIYVTRNGLLWTRFNNTIKAISVHSKSVWFGFVLSCSVLFLSVRFGCVPSVLPHIKAQQRRRCGQNHIIKSIVANSNCEEHLICWDDFVFIFIKPLVKNESGKLKNWIRGENVYRI